VNQCKTGEKNSFSSFVGVINLHQQISVEELTENKISIGQASGMTRNCVTYIESISTLVTGITNLIKTPKTENKRCM